MLASLIAQRLRHRALDDSRWLVLDVESSGLDPHRDRLLSVAAVAVRPDGKKLRLSPGDSFEVVLRQPAPQGAADKANILVHGIGVGAQQLGMPAAEALAAWARFAGASPLIGYHAAFDRVLIERAQRKAGLPLGHHAWLDLADLAPVLFAQVHAHALDEWLAHFGIGCLLRHQAAADALATAELLQRLWPRAQAQAGGGAGFRALARLAAQRRWLGA